MVQDVVEKIYRLPEDKLEQVEEYIDSLLLEQPAEDSMKEIAEKRMRNFGRMKGQIWMAPDFNDTPEDFKDYM